MTLDLPSLVGRMLVPVAVLTAFALLRRYVSARTAVLPATPTIATLATKFGKWQWAVGAAMFCVAVVFSFAGYEILVLANRYFAEADGPARFQLLPTKVIWGFFPGFGALCLTWEITRFLWSLAADKDQIARYAAWGNEKTGFDGPRVLRWMALGIALPIGLVTLPAVPMHSTLRERDMLVRGYGQISSRHYAYSQATRLMSVEGFRDRDGKFTARADLIVEFADGYRWHSEANRDFETSVNPKLIDFLELKTGLALEQAPTEDDLNRESS
jgi:hypothetical protein